MIDGVKIKQLTVNCDERGKLMEILRNDDEIFSKFGQVYLTTAYLGVVKAWHLHKEQEDMTCCVKGMLKLVLYDARDGSQTKGIINEFFIGESNPLLVKIPPNVYHGFKAIGEETAYVINVVTKPYNHSKPDEYRLPPDTGEIKYDWVIDKTKKNG